MTKSLARIQVNGYRSLKHVPLELGRITVLIGANGSGKSNLLSALRLVPFMRTGSLRRVVGEAGGASALLHYGPQRTRELEFRLEFEQDTGTNCYDARLGYAANDTFVFLDEQVGYRKPGASDFLSHSLGAGHAESKLEEIAQDPKQVSARVANWWIGRMNFFHFHDTSATGVLRQNAKMEDSAYLRSDGRNLAAFLRALSVSEDEDDRKAWTRIGLVVRRVAPYIKTLAPQLLTPKNPLGSAVRLQWTDERDYTFGPNDLSDGTLRAIALITALAQPTARLPAVITIDEPELGLHPAAIGILASLVRAVSPYCQVILATQSPALLDHFAPEEVVVTERKGGETEFRRLSTAALQSWISDYKLSELYDKNVLGGGP